MFNVVGECVPIISLYAKEVRLELCTEGGRACEYSAVPLKLPVKQSDSTRASRPNTSADASVAADGAGVLRSIVG